MKKKQALLFRTVNKETQNVENNLLLKNLQPKRLV